MPYERPEFFQGRQSLERMAAGRSGLQQSTMASLFFPPVKKMQFDKTWLKLGVRARPGKDRWFDKDMNDFMLKTTEPFFMLVFGRRGSGKTVIMRKTADTAVRSGFACAYLSDIKDEMKSSIYPATGKPAAVLASYGEMAAAMPMKVYRPIFFMKYLEERLPKGNVPFSLAYRDLNLSELLSLLGFADDSKRNQQNIISNHYKEAHTLEELRTIIDNLQGVQRSTKEPILRALEPLIRHKVLSQKPIGSFVEDMCLKTEEYPHGIVPVLNVQGFDDVGVGTATIPQIYIAVILRQIVEARIKKKLRKRVMLFVDEASDFLVPGTLLFNRLFKAVRRYRQKKIYMVFATQAKDDVPEALVAQARYTFFSHNTPPKVANQILSFNGHYRYHPDGIEELSKRMIKLRTDEETGMRQWIFIDANKEIGDDKDKLTSVFWALPSLSAHAEPE